MVLIALGPTATVLAANLSKEGLQAIDIGHLDIPYEYFLSGKNRNEKIEGKYTNEAFDGNSVVDCTDEIYQSEIILRV